MTSDLFPELISTVPIPPPLQCTYPFFIVAYWPRGKYWSIKSGLQDDEHINEAVAQLQEAGWHHVSVLKLPAGGPWYPDKQKETP